MKQMITFSSYFSCDPGTFVLRDKDREGIVFSYALQEGGELCLHLFHLVSETETLYTFSEKDAYGSLYSVLAKGVSPQEYGYYYTLNGKRLPDYLARAIYPQTKNRPELYGFLRCEESGPYRGDLRTPLKDQVLYGLHVKGFTVSDTSVPKNIRGTFEGLKAKLPYLKSLCVNAIECMPVYAPLKEENNYWGYGNGFYYALRPSFSATGDAEASFHALVRACHEEGMALYLQFSFPPSFPSKEALQVIRFYRLHYGIDGIRLIGDHPVRDMIAEDPLLTDLYILTEKDVATSLERKRVGVIDRTYRSLLRRFVKGDAGVLRDFVRSLLRVGNDVESIASLTDFSGFTAMDLVSYNWKHNEKNGEENRDGEENNDSWNCGVEGHSAKKEISSLRVRQIKNLFTLLCFTQGCIRLQEGDEVLNERDGNNNPYCQDNAIGWVTWKKTAKTKSMLSFMRELLSFRSSLRFLHKENSILMTPGKDKLLPEVSLHGKEAWNPSFDYESRAIGIAFRCEEKNGPYAVYLAMNMHWNRAELGLPHLPEGYVWCTVMNTFLTDSFSEVPLVLQEQHHLLVRERSVMVLVAKEKQHG